VKGSRVALLVVAIALVFAAVLVAYLPASWVFSRMPADSVVRCTDVGGSIWEGECLGLVVQGARIGDATWNVGRLAALRGRAVGDFDLRGAMTARANFDVDFAGQGELTDLQAALPLDPQVIPNAPPHQRANIVADLKRVTVDKGKPGTLDGSIEVRDLRQVGARPLELGSYRADFDGLTQPDGGSVGALRDLGGPFELRGTVTLTPPNVYVVGGTIAGRTGQAESLVREITLGAPPDASGRTPFSFEGSY
jgi:hypothetical protein